MQHCRLRVLKDTSKLHKVQSPAAFLPEAAYCLAFDNALLT